MEIFKLILWFKLKTQIFMKKRKKSKNLEKVNV